jgi:hypothetical protein
MFVRCQVPAAQREILHVCMYVSLRQMLASLPTAPVVPVAPVGPVAPGARDHHYHSPIRVSPNNLAHKPPQSDGQPECLAEHLPPPNPLHLDGARA